MGTRVQQNLGYGIDNLKVNKAGKLSDPRFKGGWRKWNYLNEKAHEMGHDDCLAWVKKWQDTIVNFYSAIGGTGYRNPALEMKLLISCVEGPPQEHLLTNLVHEDEGGIPSVMLILPYTCGHYRRRRDDIDYEYESILHGKEAHYHFLNRTLHPWTDWALDIKIPDSVWVELHPHRPVEHQGWDSLSQVEVNSLDPGHPDHKIVLDAIRPKLPLEVVISIFFFGDILERPVDFARELRPMIYTFWS